MGTKTPTCPTHKDNPQRAVAKKKKGFGLLAIPENMTEAQWAQKHDPLFKVKGIERHKRIHEVR